MNLFSKAVLSMHESKGFHDLGTPQWQRIICICIRLKPVKILQYDNVKSNLFSKAVLKVHESEGIHDLRMPQWQLIICIAAVYCLLYLSLFKVIMRSM